MLLKVCQRIYLVFMQFYGIVRPIYWQTISMFSTGEIFMQRFACNSSRIRKTWEANRLMRLALSVSWIYGFAWIYCEQRKSRTIKYVELERFHGIFMDVRLKWKKIVIAPACTRSRCMTCLFGWSNTQRMKLISCNYRWRIFQFSDFLISFYTWFYTQYWRVVQFELV